VKHFSARIPMQSPAKLPPHPRRQRVRITPEQKQRALALRERIYALDRQRDAERQVAQ
jgi:hypothetical protein